MCVCSACVLQAWCVCVVLVYYKAGVCVCVVLVYCKPGVCV